MNFAKRAASGRSKGFDLARCSDSIRSVFGFDWRCVRIRLARCSDSTWALDKHMLWASGFGFLASGFRLRASGSGFLLQASGCKLQASSSGPRVQALQASSFMLRAPNAGIGFTCASANNLHAKCVRTSPVKSACILRAHPKEICMQTACAHFFQKPMNFAARVESACIMPAHLREICMHPACASA